MPKSDPFAFEAHASKCCYELVNWSFFLCLQKALQLLFDKAISMLRKGSSHSPLLSGWHNLYQAACCWQAYRYPCCLSTFCRPSLATMHVYAAVRAYYLRPKMSTSLDLSSITLDIQIRSLKRPRHSSTPGGLVSHLVLDDGPTLT